jgi:hypothetical protein
MSRWISLALMALALSAFVGCESASDTSARSRSTGDEASQHPDGVCADAVGGCPETCPRVNAAAPSDAGNAAAGIEPALTCPEVAQEDCFSAHPAVARECAHAGSHPGCPVTEEQGSRPPGENCSKVCPAHAEAGASATPAPNVHTAGCGVERDSDAE